MWGKTRRRSQLSAAVIVLGPRRAGLPTTSLARWIERYAPHDAAGSVTVALVTDTRMRTLNRTFRAVDRATDVLSFPSGEPADPSQRARPIRRDAPHLGDLAIALGVAARQARAEGHGLAVELRILALHGLLHLLGYDHERDQGAMGAIEDRLRRQAGLPAGLISRPPQRATDR
jgi:probable rRNA maturation factor